MQLVIISGRSGSGKSIALQALEDLGYYAIDNLPASLMAPLIDELREGPPSRTHIAVSIDARNLPDALRRFPVLLEEIRGRGIQCQVVYLTADPRILLDRYSATRRRQRSKRPAEGGLPAAAALAHRASQAPQSRRGPRAGMTARRGLRARCRRTAL